MKKKKIARAKKEKKGWVPLEQMEWSQWFAQYILSKMVLEFHSKNKRMPTKLNLGSVSVKDLPTGEGLLSAELI